ncbi:MAG: phosphate transport system permease protein [Methanofollis sp.]|nr:phosphate transport system permease protein [Methanofollis sp.]
MKKRYLVERAVQVLSAACAALASLMLFLIVGKIAVEALPSLTWYFLTTPESMTPGLGQGIANAIVGTLVISICATVLAIPLAVMTAIHLQRYAKETVVTRLFRFFIEVMSGTPSIVIGIFGLLVFVYYLKPIFGGYSLIAGSIGLAILIMPVIERATEDAIAAVPLSLEDGSYALGATKWETIRGITLPTALSGIVTGFILGFGRAAEESAVVILTAGYSQFMPELAVRANEKFLIGYKIYPFNDVIGTLPYAVYHAYENSNVVPISNAFAAAFILIVIVLLINLTAKIVLWRCRPQ